MLEMHEISYEQLVDLGIMIGTDFHEGIKGIGPKTGLKLIKKHGTMEEIAKKNKDIAVVVADMQMPEINGVQFLSEIKKNSTENKINQMKDAAIKEIKDASIKVAVDSVKKIITTSVDKSKLDNLFQKNLDETKEELKKINS